MTSCRFLGRVTGDVTALLIMQTTAGGIVVNTASDESTANSLRSLREAPNAQFRCGPSRGVQGRLPQAPM